MVEEQSILKQDELDKTIIHQDTDVEVTLPKGLDKNTLNTVWSELLKSTECLLQKKFRLKLVFHVFQSVNIWNFLNP